MKNVIAFLSTVFILFNVHVANAHLYDGELPQKTHEYYVEKLNEKGVEVLNNTILKTVEDYEKILALNFDYYRMIDSRMKIDIVNGLDLELLSFDELVSKGISYSDEEFNRKQETNNEGAIMQISSVRLDLQIGKTKPSAQDEKWVIN